MSLLRRRLLDPALSLLKQGVSPREVSTAVAAGVVIGVCPLIGTATPLCAWVAWRWRLNMVVIQGANFLCAGLQWLLLIPFLRAGSWLTGGDPLPLSPSALRAAFAQDGLRAFLQLGWGALGAVLVWAVLAFPVAALIRQACLPAFRRMAAKPESSA